MQVPTPYPKDAPCELLNIDEHRAYPMIGQSLPMRKVFQKIAKTAPSNTSAIILGESGTGKGLNVLPIELPPLRERKEDLPLLIRHYGHRSNSP